VAKALTRPRGRRGRTSDRHERELKRLLQSVCDDTGFRLYLATYDQPETRDKLIARVAQESEAEKVRVARLDLAKAKPETNLVGLLRAHLREADLPASWRQAVMITGIEQRLDYSAGLNGFAFLHQGNLLRDALPEAAPVPVVLWLSRLASATLPAQAPDLWHWRAANFDFTGDLAPRAEVLRELIILRPGDELRLSGMQRRARIRMLEDLLAELNRVGPAKSKRQQAERANLLLELGVEDWYLGRAAKAIPRFEQALEIFCEMGDRRGEGHALGNLGLAYADLGEPRRAIEHYEKHLAMAREIGDRRGEATTLGNLGLAYAGLGELRRAIQHYEQQLAIARETGDWHGEGGALGNLGLAYANLGDPQRAIEYYEQVLPIMRQLGDRRGEGYALGNLGNAYNSLGEPRRAIEHYEHVLPIVRESGDRPAEGSTLGNLGNAYAALGEPQRAIEHYEQQFRIASETGDPLGEGNALFNSALALHQIGERGKAINRMKAADKIYEQIEHRSREFAQRLIAEWEGEGSSG
jgi:tetratricopeptide (TPR) repeat protein